MIYHLQDAIHSDVLFSSVVYLTYYWVRLKGQILLVSERYFSKTSSLFNYVI